MDTTLIIETLERESGNCKPEDKFKEYLEWDSIGLLSVQAMINEEYDVTISRDEIEKTETIAELFQLIQSKMGK
jgi:acyl carrier protein